MSDNTESGSGVDLSNLRKYHASLTSFAGARLVTLGDGSERGVRVLELRSGGGLELDVSVDRCFDIDRLAINGKTVSWHTHNGARAPWLINPFNHAGRGFGQGISGFLCTCGFDHIRQPEPRTEEDGPIFSRGDHIHYPLHGEGAYQPARLVGYGVDEDAEVPHIWCEGEVTQSIMFTGALRMTRRITIPLGETKFSIRDRVRNIGPYPMPQMTMYHFNIGYPLIGPRTRFISGQTEQVWSNIDHDIFSEFGEPRTENVEELSIHRYQGKRAGCKIENPDAGLALEMACGTASLPYLQLLRFPGEGYYMMGVEPCSTRYRSRKEARDNGELITLEPGAFQDYSIDLNLSQT